MHFDLPKRRHWSFAECTKSMVSLTINLVSQSDYVRNVVGKSVAEAVCRIQNNFRALDRIVEDLERECSSEESASYLLISLARYCYSIGVRRSVLSTTASSDAVEFLMSDSSSLPVAYANKDRSFVVPRQAIVGDRFLEVKRRTSSRELLTAFCDLALAVAPRVTPQTIRRKTPEAQLLGRLMDYDNNVRQFIDEFAETYYAKLKPLCDWNARYWEQMSLLKLDRFLSSPTDHLLLEESLQHARSAISAEVHPFSLTTLAKVLFRAMEASANDRDECFNEAWANIVEANQRERQWKSRGATLFTVCFSGVLKFFELGGQLSGEQVEMLRDMISETRLLKVRDRRLMALRGELSHAL
jgi:hypothetical protein